MLYRKVSEARPVQRDAGRNNNVNNVNNGHDNDENWTLKPRHANAKPAFINGAFNAEEWIMNFRPIARKPPAKQVPPSPSPTTATTLRIRQVPRITAYQRDGIYYVRSSWIDETAQDKKNPPGTSKDTMGPCTCSPTQHRPSQMGRGGNAQFATQRMEAHGHWFQKNQNRRFESAEEREARRRDGLRRYCDAIEQLYKRAEERLRESSLENFCME